MQYAGGGAWREAVYPATGNVMLIYVKLCIMQEEEPEEKSRSILQLVMWC